VVPFGGGQTERQVQLICDFKPDIIMVTPSYMLAIADEVERQGLDPPPACAGHLWRRALDQRHALAIEKRMGMDAVDIYGLSEVMGPGVANECVETKDGPTIWEDHFYPEIIDPETGEPVPDGEMGELVFTSLTKEALPIIRYRTRDLTRLLPGTARTMRRMEKITGRSDDMMIVRGVNVFPTQIEELILKRPELAPHYLCILTREGPLDALTVAVETRTALHRGEQAAVQLAAQQLAHEIKTFIGTSARSSCAPKAAWSAAWARRSACWTSAAQVTRLLLLYLVHQQIEVDVAALVDADAHRQVLQRGREPHFGGDVAARVGNGPGLEVEGIHRCPASAFAAARVPPRRRSTSPPRPGAPSRSSRPRPPQRLQAAGKAVAERDELAGGVLHASGARQAAAILQRDALGLSQAWPAAAATHFFVGRGAQARGRPPRPGWSCAGSQRADVDLHCAPGSGWPRAAIARGRRPATRRETSR
jgi:hypothetical protein